MHDSFYETTQIYPWLYRICDQLNSNVYLILGNEKALLFDSGNGLEPIMPIISSITRLPVEIILSHGHIDHAGGSYLFDSVWLHEKDKTLCLRHTGKTAKRGIITKMQNSGVAPPRAFDEESYIHSGTGNIKAVEAGQVFNLAGLTAEIISLSGHTQGSVGVLVHESRVLFTGDAIIPNALVFMDESTSVSEYIAMLERTILMDFDTFYCAHVQRGLPKSLIKSFISVAKNIDLKNTTPFTRFLPELGGLVYAEKDVSIAFRPDKL